MRTILHGRRKALQGAVMVLGLMLLASGCLNTSQKSTLDLMNRDRKAYSLHSLPIHSSLQKKAQAWANKLAWENKLSHSDLASGAPSCWRGLGENVGYGASIAQVQAAYMASAGHRANILNSKWDYVGVGVAHNGSRVFTVQVFMDGC